MSLFTSLTTRVYSMSMFIQLLMMSIRQRAIQALSALVAFLLPGMAFADGDVADMLDSVAAGAKRGKTSVLEAAQFVGVIIFIGSLLAFKKIGSNPQITLGRCIGGLIIGAMLVLVPELMSRSQKQLGMSSVTVS